VIAERTPGLIPTNKIRNPFWIRSRRRNSDQSGVLTTPYQRFGE